MIGCSPWIATWASSSSTTEVERDGQSARPDYLIDHSPDMASALGHRLVITSRSVTELEALLRPVLEQYGLSCGRADTPWCCSTSSAGSPGGSH